MFNDLKVRISVIGARNLAALCLNGRFSCCGAAIDCNAPDVDERAVLANYSQ